MGTEKKSPKRKGKKKKAIRSDDLLSVGQEMGIPSHKHCFNCGKAISLDKEICSDSCQEEWDRMLKRKKMITYLPIIGGVLLILFYILIMTQGG